MGLWLLQPIHSSDLQINNYNAMFTMVLAMSYIKSFINGEL